MARQGEVQPLGPLWPTHGCPFPGPTPLQRSRQSLLTHRASPYSWQMSEAPQPKARDLRPSSVAVGLWAPGRPPHERQGARRQQPLGSRVPVPQLPGGRAPGTG